MCSLPPTHCSRLWFNFHKPVEDAHPNALPPFQPATIKRTQQFSTTGFQRLKCGFCSLAVNANHYCGCLLHEPHCIVVVQHNMASGLGQITLQCSQLLNTNCTAIFVISNIIHWITKMDWITFGLLQNQMLKVLHVTLKKMDALTKNEYSLFSLNISKHFQCK